ncbi:uncharacterized protein N7459_001625 [Penicillium hispanicum]|uniref:uncharacterized protein n=1 Tax=Penicillium hispanicum TaxID=1080232 RepID=UPI0025410E44|nr:uncharacterized protein N7459_001625 [Penicillium hispanicum]KAJ5595417.1 hypothetical protein N7459_001625 [Penicillium hispanicum]
MDPEDYDDRWSVKNSEEIEAIQFEWTPELVRLATSRCQLHPILGPLEQSNRWPYHSYRPDMALPDPADTRECLEWFGLSDEKIIEVEQKFNELYPDFPSPVCGYDEQFSSKGRNAVTFPALDTMVKVYYGMLDHWNSDYEYTHEGYIKKGIQQGLRPEFAVFCGMHKDDPRCIDDPLLFERDWFDTSPTEIITYFTSSFWETLKKFMTCQLVHDEKAWHDEHGYWLVHEGENIDQARERVHGLDLQQLREQATQEEDERTKRAAEERKRLIDLELAEAEAEYREARGEQAAN